MSPPTTLKVFVSNHDVSFFHQRLVFAHVGCNRLQDQFCRLMTSAHAALAPPASFDALSAAVCAALAPVVDHIAPTPSEWPSCSSLCQTCINTRVVRVRNGKIVTTVDVAPRAIQQCRAPNWQHLWSIWPNICKSSHITTGNDVRIQPSVDPKCIPQSMFGNHDTTVVGVAPQSMLCNQFQCVRAATHQIASNRG